jgi:hypothetical protein
VIADGKHIKWHFRETYWSHLQGQKIRGARYKRESSWHAEQAVLAACFHTGILLGLFFGPEYGGDMFL